MSTAQSSTIDPLPSIAARAAKALNLPERSIEAVMELLDEKATVPFIARYRKERTGNLDELQIRAIQEFKEYQEELDARRKSILKSIEEQGKLDEALRHRILACEKKQELEDLYLPFKPKRRTKAAVARERGLGPLADRILAQPREGDPQAEAERFVDAEKGVETAAQALEGARDIVIETITEMAELRQYLRQRMLEQGVLRSRKSPAFEEKQSKYEDYYDFEQPLKDMPSHRVLAIRRGENEGVLMSHIELDPEPILRHLWAQLSVDERSPFADELRQAAQDALKRRLLVSIEIDVRLELKQRADLRAIEIFADNLQQLLLAPPMGAKAVVGIDPGLRTGCKCAALSATGAFLEHRTIYPSRGAREREEAAQALVALVQKHGAEAVAVGNGTGGRETESFVRETLRAAGMGSVVVVSVSESGASVYSASEIAREEFPELDLTIRGAISIGRRLQDPLAELVKVEAKAVGVGQYQHDVDQVLLQRKLDEVVESCVNRVGVELNTASASLLSYVSGINKTLATRIVAHRTAKGAFVARKSLQDVQGFGPKTFEQAAGFLRVRESAHPLDKSAVHPERYALVERMAEDLSLTLDALVGNHEAVARIELKRYVDAQVGELTLQDVVEELRKPGRDPRKSFEPPAFREDISELEHLQEGMCLEGVVTNLTAFGAFVDVGVHQDGLVHISELSERFVRDPKEVVSVGQKIKVWVLSVDLGRRRIALSAKGPADEASRERRNTKGSDDGAIRGRQAARPAGGRPPGGKAEPKRFQNNAFAALLKK